MARPLRIEYKGVFYHSTYRGYERRRICFANWTVVDSRKSVEDITVNLS